MPLVNHARTWAAGPATARAFTISAVTLTGRTRQWMWIWVPPMAIFTAIAVAGLALEMMLIPVRAGRYMNMGAIAVLTAVTIGLNMWMSWQGTRR